MIGLIARIVTIILCLPTLVWAQEYPASQSLYVNDFAGIIDAETESRLTGTLKDLKKSHGIEMTVVTISSVNDYDSTQSVPDFTTGLFNAWGVGDATRNDGIVFLTSLNDREMFIGLGSGYSPVYDDRMDRVFEYHVKPYFVKEDYAQGIEVGVLETIKRTSANYVEDTSRPSLLKRISGNTIDVIFWLAFTFIAACIVWGIIAKKFSDALYGIRRCPNCNRRKLSRNRNQTVEPTYEAPGEEQVHVICRNCEYRNDTINVIAQRSRNTGRSGGGGFGGGGSSGGGGGGKW